MTTTAPQPVASPTVGTQDAPTPRTHSGPARKVLAGLAATLVVAGGIGVYFAANTSGSTATTPVTTDRLITSGGVDIIERSAATQTSTSGGVDVIERSAVGRTQSTNRPDVTEQAVPSSATVTSGGVDVIERQGCSVQCQAAKARLEARTM
jgi:hypothetical protein